MSKQQEKQEENQPEEEIEEQTEEKSKKKRKEKTVEEKPETLSAKLESVKKQQGIVGYILRNTESASIDLKDPTKLIDFAVLSSSALKTGEKIASLFKLGGVKNVLVEGKEAKVLSLTIGENRVSVFMENGVDQNKIYKEIT